MDCLQLRIPPLPQFLTAGHSVWQQGLRHFRRSFPVYNLLFVRSGTLYMAEEGREFAVQGGELLLLEPDRLHEGYRECGGPTEIYWVHFSHPAPLQTLALQQVAWSAVVKESTDSDQVPAEQFLYLPKYGRMDQAPLLPLLVEMVELRGMLTMERAVQRHVLLARLLAQLQSGMTGSGRGSRSYAVAQEAKRCLEEHFAEPYQSSLLTERLHFDIDYIARCLRRHTGLSPLQYVQQLRMKEAQRLLAVSALEVQDIARQVGYADYNYFIRVFRRHAGMSPGAYRRWAAGYV